MSKMRIIDKLKEYHFQLKHLTVIFVTVFAFQLIVSLINKSSMRSIVGSAQEWYEKDSAEKTANLTTTAFELLLESVNPVVRGLTLRTRRELSGLSISSLLSSCCSGTPRRCAFS